MTRAGRREGGDYITVADGACGLAYGRRCEPSLDATLSASELT